MARRRSQSRISTSWRRLTVEWPDLRSESAARRDARRVQWRHHRASTVPRPGSARLASVPQAVLLAPACCHYTLSNHVLSLFTRYQIQRQPDSRPSRGLHCISLLGYSPLFTTSGIYDNISRPRRELRLRELTIGNGGRHEGAQYSIENML